MLKKMKLKRKRKKSKFKTLIIVLILMLLFVLLILMVYGKKMSNKIMEYAEMEVTKISKIVVNNAVDEAIINKMDTSDIYTIERNNNSDIQSIDFNATIVNRILMEVGNNIQDKFKKIENGKLLDLDLNNNLVTNTTLEKRKKGIIMEIPSGVITKNALLSNLGPKIPVRLSFNGELESYISTKVQNYGINNALINIYLNIKVSEQIILPVTTKKITIENSIPITIKMIQGNIPNYYLNGINTNSNLLTLPSENNLQ